jgi:aryl-alcohol dehydrogenase-like predicted oxidoreductase
MQYANLGKSNLSVSRICLGTMHFGSRTSEQESFKIMDRALEMGINFFDTANVYGGSDNRGGSETIIGKWFQQNPTNRDKVVLATKVYGKMSNESWPNTAAGISAYKVRKHVEDSLRRLQTDHIDLYQIHHIDYTVTPEEFWGTFDRLVNDGKMLYLGSSNFPGWGLAKYQMQALARGSMGFISEQTMYNLLCRYPELEVLPASLDMGIGVIPYMPLAGGLLTGKTQSIEGSRTSQVEDEYGIKLGQTNSMMAQFSELCKEIGESESVVAIAWTLAHPAIPSAIVGIRTFQHLDNMDRAAELKLDAEIMHRLDEIFPTQAGRSLRTGKTAPEAYAW